MKMQVEIMNTSSYCIYRDSYTVILPGHQSNISKTADTNRQAAQHCTTENWWTTATVYQHEGTVAHVTSQEGRTTSLSQPELCVFPHPVIGHKGIILKNIIMAGTGVAWVITNSLGSWAGPEISPTSTKSIKMKAIPRKNNPANIQCNVIKGATG